MVYVFIYFIASVVGWSRPNNVTRSTRSCVWSLRSMARLAIRETHSGTIRVAASAMEGMAPTPAMT